MKKLKSIIKKLKKDIGALYCAYERIDTPLIAKIIAIIAVGYALSPMDLIPDFIPILGYLDDLILLPLIIMLAIKLIPNNIMSECRSSAEKIFNKETYNSRITGCIIIGIWISLFVLFLIKILT